PERNLLNVYGHRNAEKPLPSSCGQKELIRGTLESSCVVASVQEIASTLQDTMLVKNDQLLDDQYRHCAEGQNLRCLTSQQQLVHAATAMRCNDNQISVSGF